MAADEAREDACRDYQSSLEDLTFNSKPHINMLTILAEENVQFARDIVTLIEAQIAKAPSTEKLPVMYLMDSIVKNVGGNYQTAFAKNIVSTFVNVFEKSINHKFQNRILNTPKNTKVQNRSPQTEDNSRVNIVVKPGYSEE
ncbi:unnamed protein product [Ranitomeya imitator]|uniref:CID domain-containing protein n=1 Tax=Ranitomeya imitator TaxID=111125 RepID=A0ABN9M0Z4_9NEOB|nr:unnamed protein product [Ranitomeya imitator]